MSDALAVLPAGTEFTVPENLFRKITEDEAYRLLRRSAMNENRRIADVAKALVSAYTLLGDG